MPAGLLTPLIAPLGLMGLEAEEPAVATYTLDGPGTGTVGAESSDFMVELGAGVLAGPVTITPDDGSDGSFTPSSVELTDSERSATFTYTPASAGSKTISTTNSGDLTDPDALSFTASASGGGSSGRGRVTPTRGGF